MNLMSIKNTAKIFVILSSILFLFSCEQHFFYLKKVKVNNETIKTENHSEISKFSSTFKTRDSIKLTNENVYASSETSNYKLIINRVDTPKSYVVKKVQDGEEKSLKFNNKVTNFSENNSNLLKTIIGILFIVTGVILLLLGVLIFLTSDGSSYGCSPILSIIFGVISLIFGLGLAFINY